MRDRADGAGPGFVKRVAWGTVAAAGIVGALAMAPGPGDHAASPVSINAAMERPMQPPPPPPGWPPPALHQPGQEGPGTGQYDRPPPPASPEPNENAICDNVMLAPPECYLYGDPDPSFEA